MEVEAANVASVSITVQIVMLVFTFIVGHLLRRRKIMVVHEAGAALLIGMLRFLTQVNSYIVLLFAIASKCRNHIYLIVYMPA